MPKRLSTTPAAALAAEINRWALAHRRAKHYSQLRRAETVGQVVEVLLRLTTSISWSAADRHLLIQSIRITETVLPSFRTVRYKLQRCRQRLE